METVYESNQEQPKPVEYAGFWWRFLAYVIDEIILSFVSWIFILPILGIFGISLYSLKEAGFDPDDAYMYIGPMIGAITSIAFKYPPLT